jgi:hypothetical protein
MDTRASTDSPEKPASIAEIVAINIAWPCGLSGFTAGLATQNTGLAFPGLTVSSLRFLHLVRAYHFRRTDHDVVQASHAHRLATDPSCG